MPFVKEIRIVYDGQTPIEEEFTKTYHDLLGRMLRIEYADDTSENHGYQTYGYNEKGQLQWIEDPDGVTTFYGYNELGRHEDTAILVSGPTIEDKIDYGGTDRVSGVRRAFTQVSDVENPLYGMNVEKTEYLVWPDNGSTNEAPVRTVYTTVNGIQDGRESWSNEDGKKTYMIVEFLGNGVRTETVTHPDGNYTESEFENGRIVEETFRSTTGWELASVFYVYDDYRRLWERTESGVGTSEYTYYDDDRIESVIVPNSSQWQSGPAWDSQTTSYVYDEMGRTIKVTYHDDTEVEFAYHATGELRKTWGARTYPVEYEYDDQGRMTKMTTWQDFDGLLGSAETKWKYDSDRGWLTKKIHADGDGPTYGYTPAGRPESRIWARGIETDYGYDPNTGALTTIQYSDDTPNVTYNYNRLGQRQSIEDGSGFRELEYTLSGTLLSEEYKSSSSADEILLGRKVAYQYSSSTGRLEEIEIRNGQTVLHTQKYSYYGSNGRLWKVEEGAYDASYMYSGSTYRVASIGFQKNSNVVETSSWELDAMGRVERTYIGLNWWWDPKLVQQYYYNAANQRIRMAWEGEDEPDWVWVYDYDDLGQLESAERHWGDYWSWLPDADPAAAPDPVKGQHYGYTFDDIGNRTQTVVNFRSSGGRNPIEIERTANYTVDQDGLNQYTERQTPNLIDVLGFSMHDENNSDLEVNGVTAWHREGEYFYHRISNLSNSESGPYSPKNDVYLNITVEELENGTPVGETSGYHYLSEDPERYSFEDALNPGNDGNLLSCGRWEYKWDAENRLVEMVETRYENYTSVPRRKINFFYDDRGRKVRSETAICVPSYGGCYWSDQSGFAWQRHYVYSDWNVIGEGYANPSGTGNWTIDKTYLWGLDLAERTDYRATNGWSSIGKAAGGVGGLLLVTDHGENEAHFVHHDGNGNVVALIDADGNGELSAIYDYDPFGNLIRASGEAAELNPFRFSTKYHHDYYDVYYYGFRFYSPSQGRFLNRDPINEPGSILGRNGRFIDWEIEFDLEEEGNLYAFVRNDAVNAIDYLGLQRRHPPTPFREWQCPRGQSRGKRADYKMEDPDGCSADFLQWLRIVGDKDRPFPEVSFLEACNTHDICYRTCQPAVDVRAEKRACDEEFAENLADACNSAGLRNDRDLRRCMRWARRYAEATHSFGWGAYEGNQRDACGCCS